MKLQQLWDKMVAAANAQDQVIAGVYAPYIADMSDDLGDLYEPQEYPKWVGDKVVHSADEERALSGEPEATAVPVDPPVDGDAPDSGAVPDSSKPPAESAAAPAGETTAASDAPVDPALAADSGAAAGAGTESVAEGGAQ